MNQNIIERELAHSIVGAFYDVYKYFDFGLVEKIYCRALKYALEDRGHEVRREVYVPVSYRGRPAGTHRLDIVVDNRVLVEVKATELLPKYSARQIVSYLRVTPYQVGLLLHFGPEPKFYRFVDTKPKRWLEAHSNLR
jgi:GxxExxY protein